MKQRIAEFLDGSSYAVVGASRDKDNGDITSVTAGAGLDDDVIDIELLLIFGGPDGMMNPSLTSDNVPLNDKPFLNTFPYLATEW